MSKIKLVQVGVVGLRTPTGEISKTIPLYREIEVNEDGLTNGEKKAAEKFVQLMERQIDELKSQKERRKENAKI